MDFGNGVAISTTRPNNTTAYDAGDCIGATTDSGGAYWIFPLIGQSAGGELMITTLQFEVDASSVPSGMTSFTLHLYSGAPNSAYADGSTWDLPSGDRSSYLGYVSLGTPADLGSTLYVETVQYNKQVSVPRGGALYGYLVTTGGFTPSANTVFKITLHSIGL